jgi:hypothetical protein
MEQIALMKISNASKYILGIFAAAGILAGCSGSQSGLSGTGANPSQMSPQAIRALTSTAHVGIQRNLRPDTRQSWIAPDVHKKDKHILYVADDDFDAVFSYGLPAGKEIGEISGFDEPQGECTSGKDWWVTNTGDSDAVEYAAGGTTSIGTVSDPGEYPVGCTYDKKTGNLALTNIISTSDGEGSVDVYAHGTGTPTSYTCSSLYRYYFAGYDDKGNLFVDGENEEDAFGFCELPSGSSTMTNITLNVIPEFPGGVQWDGTYIVVGDQDAETLYGYTISGSSGTEKRSTVLDDMEDCDQFWIQTNKVYCGSVEGAEELVYAYPAGGSPIKTITGLGEPIGAVVAAKKR